MIIRTFIVLSAVLLSCHTPDKIKVSLKKKVNPPILGSYIKNFGNYNKSNDYAHIAAKHGLDTFFVVIHPHFPDQFRYNQFRKGEITTDVYLRFATVNKTDTLSLSNTTFYDAETIVLVGKRGDDLVLIPDYNNNNHLEEDSPIIQPGYFTKEVNNEWTPPIKVKNLIGFYKGKRIEFSEEFSLRALKRIKYKSNGDMEIQELSLFLKGSEYYVGKFRVGSRRYQMAINTSVGNFLFTRAWLDYTRVRKKFPYQESYDPHELNRIQDTLKIGEQYYLVSDIAIAKKRTVYLSKTQLINTNPERSILEDFSFADLMTGDSVRISELVRNKKGLIIDFWGSWCQPCMASFPALKKLHDSLSKDYVFFNFAYDKADPEKVKGLIKKYNLTWNHHLVEEPENTILRKYRVMGYPSYFLIDSNLNIIYRGVGEEGLEGLRLFIKNRK